MSVVTDPAAIRCYYRRDWLGSALFSLLVAVIAVAPAVAQTTITVPTGSTQTFPTTMSGSGSVNVQGGGTAILSGANTYTGGTAICAGTCGVAGGNSTTVQVTNSNPGTSSSIGTGSLTFDAGTLQAGASGLVFSNNAGINSTGATIDSNGTTLTLSGLFQNGTGSPGTLTIVNTGRTAGTVTLTNDNNLFTGATAINSGTLALNSGGSLALSSGVAVASGATFDISGNGPGATSIKTLSGAGTVQIGSSGLILSNASSTFSGGISGGGAVQLTGGTETFSGANAYTGGTTLSGGTLQAGNNSALGTGALTLDGGTLQAGAATLTIGNAAAVNTSGGTIDANGNSLTLSGVIANGNGTTGTVTIASSTAGGTVTLTGANTYTGVTNVGSGTLAIGPGGSIASSSGLGLGGGAGFDISKGGNETIQDLNGVVGSGIALGGNALTLGTANNSSYGGVIADGGLGGGTGGSLVKQGSGTLLLSGSNTYTGGTTVNAGTLAGNGTQAFGTGSVTLASGTTLQAAAAGLSGTSLNVSNAIVLAGNATFDTQGGTLGVGGVISGGGSLTKIGSGTLTLSNGSNSYTGATTVNAGTLALGNIAAVATSSGVNLAVSGTTLDIANAGGSTKVTTLSGVAGSVVNLGANQLVTGNNNVTTTFAGVIQGSGSLFELPTGTGSLILTGANTYTGQTTVTSGTLSIGAGGSIAASSGVNIIAGGTFDISNGGNQTIGDLASASGGAVTLGGNTLTAGTANSTTFAGVMSGAGGGLTKQGGGALTLTGVNTYTGGTTINAGTLALQGNGSIAQSAVNLAASGATFDVSAANSPAVDGLSGAGGTTVNLGGGTLVVNQTGTSTFAGSFVGSNPSDVFVEGGGNLVLTGTNTNMTGSFFIDDGKLSIGPGGSVSAAVGGIAVNGGAATFDISNAGGDQTVLNLGGIGAGSVTLGANTLTIINTRANLLPAIISGTGGLVVDAPSSLTLSGANTYSGPTTVNGGATLFIGAGGSIASSSSLTINGGGTFDIGSQGGGNQTVNNLSGVNASVILGPFNLTVNSTASTSYDGTISGSTPINGLIKTGPATLTLIRGVSYIGPTTIEAGTLALGAFGSLQSSSEVNLAASGAILDVSGVQFALSPTTIQDLVGVSGTTVALGTVGLNVGTANSTTYAGVFTGSGALTKQGTGTLTLAGNSGTFTGATTVNAGTLALSGAGAIGQSAVNLAAGGTVLDVSAASSPAIGSLSGVGGSTVNLGGTTLAVNQTGTSTFAGSFVGNNSSDVFLQGGGNLVLTGANTNMTGSFFIDDGKLSIGPGGSVSAAVGGIAVNGGAATFDISNAGGNQTVLNLGGIGAGSVTLGANTLTIINTQANLLPAIISGTGGLIIDAPSTLTLSGANTYTGPTTVNGGTTLFIGAGGSIASSSSLTINGGGTFDIGSQGGGNQTVNNLTGTNAQVVLGPYNLTVNSTVATIYDGSITGLTPINGLIKTGPATLTLARGGSYIGPTTIEAGTLALGGFGSLQSSSEINLATSGATFDVSGVQFALSPTTIQDLVGVSGTTVALGTVGLNVGTANSTTFAGVFTGSGPLTKQGTGTLTLDGNSSGFTGATTIAAGTLEVGDINSPGAALGGNVTIDAGGTLAGHGSILGGVTNTAGTLSPGGTIGTMTIAGNYTQGSAGTLSIEVSPTAASQLKVGGAASLNGKLALVFDPGTYYAASYKLLTANSVTGTFSSVTGANPSGLTQALLYDPSDVTLQLSGFPRNVAPTNATIYTAVTSTAILNAQQVNGIILDRLGARAGGIVDGQVAAAPAGASTVHIAQNGPAGPLGDIAAALPQALSSQGAWFRGVGGFASVNGNSTAPGFTGSTGGFLAGYDRPVAPNMYIGLAGGYLHSGINEHSTSTGSEDSARFAVYGGMLVGTDLLSGTAGYAHDWFNTQRGFAGIGTATANNGGDEVTAAGQWSHSASIAGLNGGVATLTPKAGLQYLHLSEGAFSDFGAGGLDLSSRSHGTDSLQPFVQVALSQKFTTENGTIIAPELRLGYAYELFDSRVLTVTTAGGTAFPVTGVAPSRNQLSAGVGLVMEAAPNLSVYADYDTILHTGNTTEQTLQAGLRLKF